MEFRGNNALRWLSFWGQFLALIVLVVVVLEVPEWSGVLKYFVPYIMLPFMAYSAFRGFLWVREDNPTLHISDAGIIYSGLGNILIPWDDVLEVNEKLNIHLKDEKKYRQHMNLAHRLSLVERGFLHGLLQLPRASFLMETGAIYEAIEKHIPDRMVDAEDDEFEELTYNWGLKEDTEHPRPTSGYGAKKNKG
ncbi:hypothetical protein [Kordiimonas laminariae]|uniref:hypothetical protein n=1 Tax=Kordiimonas laminariae TaxID=2917717 RepID=UPI001FF300F6|nr:hypothetical protein [Kordiimonas laminariae]MCK0068174.1 hypothetical protein [Kordiimonas laminariae]